MTTAAGIFAEFAASLRFEDIPKPVVERAKDCIIHTTGVTWFGARFPWSRMVAEYALRYGQGGPCSILGVAGAHVHAPYAALANGVSAHAFEMNSTRHPGVGGHGSATLLPAVIAACEETGASGKTMIAAYVAGCEVLFRVAMATHGSRIAPESMGFHLPGIIGPYGAALSAGYVFGLSASQFVSALGIAGSLSSGLLAFTKSAQGGMVKRLHLGRASEAGLLAARLAGSGYTGPETVFEGKFGLLEVYCRDARIELLTADLGKEWETLRIGMKRYACHQCNQTSIQSLRQLMMEHEFNGDDVAKVVIEGREKLVSHHDIREPGDTMQGQYSAPFCIAVALYRDPEDPRSFEAGALEDTRIRSACRTKIELRGHPKLGKSTKYTKVRVALKDGRTFERETDSYKGLPTDPLSGEELRKKFTLLLADADRDAAVRLHDRLRDLESLPRFVLS